MGVVAAGNILGEDNGQTDFLNELRRDPGAVLDDASSLDAPDTIVANALGKDLGEIIPSDNEIHYGIQLEGLECTPFGNGKWALRTARHVGLEAGLRPHGRARKEPEK